MFIATNTRKKNGKEYVYKYLARSEWDKKTGKSKKIMIANISQLPAKTIATLENSLKNNVNTVLLENIVVKQSIDYGQCLIILEIMKRLKIKQAIESGLSKEEKGNSKYALLIILGKIVTRGSKLSIVNWIKRNKVISVILGFTEKEINNLTEKDLYKVQFDINNIQPKIEQKWVALNKQPLDTIFLYDITSFYFEGTENELACFGYNRDKKQGKKIITVGLITDKAGFPLKIEVFKGNTKDEKTVPAQLQALRNEFGANNITLIGDRGMKIRYNLEVMEEANKSSIEAINYISGLTTSEIRELEKNRVIEMSLFDKELVEIEHQGKRYILCVNPVLEEEKHLTRKIMKEKFELELLSVQKSFESQKTKCELNRDRIAKEEQENKPKSKLKVELTEKEVKAWEYRIKKAQEKYKMQKVYTVTITKETNKESFDVKYDILAFEELGKLDGKYVFETTVKKEIMNKEEIRQAYKQLQKVEHAFRDMKISQLNLRPIFHRKEETTRSHIFLGMFSYAIIREIEIALYPWLKEQKNTKNNKLSFDDFMEEIKMIRLCVISFGEQSHQIIKITELNDNQKIIISLLNINEAKLMNFKF